MIKKHFVLYTIILILIICGIVYIPEMHRKFKYGNFVTIASLKHVRANHKSILIGDSIFTYGGYITYPLKNDYESIEIYNINSNTSELIGSDVAKQIELTNLDIIKVWNDYLIIFRKGLHTQGLENTLGYYNLKTKKFDRLIKPKYFDKYDDFFVLSNGDVVLYNLNCAEKYSYTNNSYYELRKYDPKNNFFYFSPNVIPLENKNDAYLLISQNAAYVYEDNKFKKIIIDELKIEDFSNIHTLGEPSPIFISVDNGKFVVLSYDCKTHLNKIRVYKLENERIKLISNFETKRILHSLLSGNVIKVNNNEILILGGHYGVYPLLVINSTQNYLFNIAENKIHRIADLNKRAYSYVVYDSKVYLLGGYFNKKYLKEIDVLEIKK